MVNLSRGLELFNNRTDLSRFIPNPLTSHIEVERTTPDFVLVLNQVSSFFRNQLAHSKCNIRMEHIH